MRFRRALVIAGSVIAASSSFAQEAAEPDSSPPDEQVAPAPVEPPPAPPPSANSLDELLGLVKQGYSQERSDNKAREERFRQAKQEQTGLLEEALARVAREESRSERLEDAFSGNETTLGLLEEKLEDRLGTMGELFGVVRQVAGDMQGHVWESVISSQLGNRKELLEKLGRGKSLPTTDDLEKLWFEIQREMTEQGKVVSYPATVLTVDGVEDRRDVIRAGVFSVVSGGRYLLWDATIQKIRELNRQPPSRYVGTVGPYEKGENGDQRSLAVDPSRGSLLTALIDTPSRTERIQQGGPVGYTIITLGIFALLVGVVKWVSLSTTSRRVQAQRDRPKADPRNPLGRVLAVYEKNRSLDAEALELRLDQAVIGEAEKLERFMWLVRTVSVVAPLLGLLGTVTGMIQTFQAITLFGAGDPKMMAGGISEALVTTMLGLMTAAPLVLLYAFLSTSKRRILSVLSGQSAGLVATRVEEAGG